MSALLFDTHIVLWWLADDQRLGASLQNAVREARSVHVSSASTWEVAIKRAIGKLALDLAEDETFPSACTAQGFRLTDVDHDDAWAVSELPPNRADPFDRLIAATARRRGWTVVTADAVFAELDVPTLGP